VLALDNRIFKFALPVAGVAFAVLLGYLALTRPGYFTSLTYVGSLLFLEILLGAVWLYRRAFFPITIVVFLLAGVDLPVGTVWNMLRWMVLGLGALVGCAIVLKERRFSFGMFDIVAFLALLAAGMSAAVSRYSTLSFLKVSSLVLLFIYGATGSRLAVQGRESRFFTGLLTGCQILVGIVAAFYFSGVEMLGNPNSLGAVMGVAAVPVLLWGALLKQSKWAHRSQLLFYGLAMYLTYLSHARAAIAAAILVSLVLCVCLRRFAYLAVGVGLIAIVVAAMAILQPEELSRSVASFNDTIVYKGKDPTSGLLSSRETPWQETMDAIQDHYWFGTGFGTSDKGVDPTENLGKFSSSSLTSREHGSSYLEIFAWVGVVGVLPFVMLLGGLLAKILRTMFWMFKTGNPAHPAVPLAMVMMAGICHAAFEDWLFAPGYYLCIFFWSMSFVFVDSANLLRFSTRSDVDWSRLNTASSDLSVVTPGR